jgi:hypothetical protein
LKQLGQDKLEQATAKGKLDLFKQEKSTDKKNLC